MKMRTEKIGETTGETTGEKTGERIGSGPQKGFTIVELMVSLVIFSVIMVGALSFLQIQTKGFRTGLDYMSTVQTLRYAVGTLEQDVQTAGINLSPGQPEVVYAGADVLAFNADYGTRTRVDPFAVFFDPDLEDRSSRAMRASDRAHIPQTSFSYPDSTYREGSGLPGPAETLVFYFLEDQSTSRSDDFSLYRQVNREEPQLVSDNLLRVENQPFFRYMKESEFGVDSIADGLLPLSHSIPIHGSAADTGRVSLVDSIRAVRITAAATNGREGERERLSELTRIVRMPNMGFGVLETCGSPPLLGTGLTATLVTLPEGESAVDLTWGRSTDEQGGENDVVRYVIWRRDSPTGDWGEPYLSIPAGETNYLYQDAALAPGGTYQYGMSAQDCTPTLSKMSPSTTVIIPT